MEYTDRKKTILRYLEEKQMRESGIEICYTNKLYDTETIEIKSIKGEGLCLFDAEAYTPDDYKSLVYKNNL